jgi:hypothetical protein
MKNIIRHISIAYFILISLVSFGQIDTTTQNYIIKKHFPFYHSCKNCKIEENRPRMLCGHNYNTIFTGYSFDGNHWADIGFAKDRASCFPDRGSDYFAASYSVMMDQNFINSFNIKYLRDNLFGLQFYFIKYGLNIETITDFNKADFVLGPEIRLSDNMDYSHLLRKINISYRYNIKLNDNLNGLRNFHQITITFNLIERGWIS